MTGWARSRRQLTKGDRQMTERLILGQVLQIEADPATTGPEAIGHHTAAPSGWRERPDRRGRDRPMRSAPPIPTCLSTISAST
jgi:hypothetical protein